MIHPIREWSKSYRDRGKYTPVRVAFHWIMAGVVVWAFSDRLWKTPEESG